MQESLTYILYNTINGKFKAKDAWPTWFTNDINGIKKFSKRSIAECCCDKNCKVLNARDV